MNITTLIILVVAIIYGFYCGLGKGIGFFIKTLIKMVLVEALGYIVGGLLPGISGSTCAAIFGVVWLALHLLKSKEEIERRR